MSRVYDWKRKGLFRDPPLCLRRDASIRDPQVRRQLIENAERALRAHGGRAAA